MEDKNGTVLWIKELQDIHSALKSSGHETRMLKEEMQKHSGELQVKMRLRPGWTLNAVN